MDSELEKQKLHRPSSAENLVVFAIAFVSLCVSQRGHSVPSAEPEQASSKEEPEVILENRVLNDPHVNALVDVLKNTNRLKR